MLVLLKSDTKVIIHVMNGVEEALFVLDRKNSKPLYEQLKNIIEEKIISGNWEADAQIPSEKELADMYKVSRITVRQAISLAERSQLVKKVQGLGTFVEKKSISQPLESITSFQSTIEQLGLIASTRLIKSSTITSDFQLSRILNTNIMDKVVNIQLLGFGDNDPVVFYNSYFPFELGFLISDFSKEMAELNKPFSTMDYYYNSLEYKPTHVEQTFEAILSDEETSLILCLPIGSPLLKVTSIVYKDENPLEFKESFYKGDIYKFFVTRRLNF